MAGQAIDPGFTAYPLRELAAAALQRAADLGAQHADFRAERIREQHIGLSDGSLETLFDGEDLGLAVRVVVDGTWGFASAVDLTQAAALRAAGEAVEVARVATLSELSSLCSTPPTMISPFPTAAPACQAVPRLRPLSTPISAMVASM